MDCLIVGLLFDERFWQTMQRFGEVGKAQEASAAGAGWESGLLRAGAGSNNSPKNLKQEGRKCDQGFRVRRWVNRKKVLVTITKDFKNSRAFSAFRAFRGK